MEAAPNPGRSLVKINSTQQVIIESNDLVNGDNAIYIQDNSGPVLVRYNHITGNTGYAVYTRGHSTGAALDIVANNLHANRSGSSVECSADATGAVANRKANHNYWGASSPSQETSHCNLISGKRLVAPVLLRSGVPVLTPSWLPLARTRPTSIITRSRTAGTGRVQIRPLYCRSWYFSEAASAFHYCRRWEDPMPCSDTFDVFLPEGAAPSGSLEFSDKI